MFKKSLAIACLSLSLFVNTSEAALLLVDGTGQLTGANDVNVNGALYDVSFGDGSCISLFSGCDSSDDFTFKTLSEITDAGEALLAQVFLGTFDDNSELTQGCEDNQQCRVYVAYGFDNVAGQVKSLQASNFSTGWGTDSVSAHHFSNVPDANNVLSDGWRTYAVFKASAVAVPTPATLLLLGSGFLGLIALTRRKGMVL